ncbi:NADH-quinone oxidoreductase subunit NuoK [Nitrosomonas marina]|uniref:NADH-quinone oxidoreductase subunit K n=1 Tax=Nitrosomonas marina TaxID=917 RepID=A0A1H8HWA3_9PROT|nr:NADH-quinone oxidoreductase subunit NuoK [Nitrosomonas marina]SEN60509.1 NADH dehydrogenase subunit K [Nitrosomonas marina]
MIPLSHSLIIAALLFTLGLLIIMLRRELLFILMGLEVMFNGAALTAIAAGQYWTNADGQVLTIFLTVVTAAELAIALILVWLVFERLNTTRADNLKLLKDNIDRGPP